jgi:hypothetical protein
MQIFYLSVLKVVVESDCSIGTVRTKIKTDEINSTKYHMIIKTVVNRILMLDSFFVNYVLVLFINSMYIYHVKIKAR